MFLNVESATRWESDSLPTQPNFMDMGFASMPRFFFISYRNPYDGVFSSFPLPALVYFDCRHGKEELFLFIYAFGLAG